jgi:hypothetical protein
VQIGDVVFSGDACGEVAVCLLQGVELSVVVKTFTRRAVNRWAAEGGGYEMWVASAVEPALAWQMQADGTLLVLRH